MKENIENLIYRLGSAKCIIPIKIIHDQMFKLVDKKIFTILRPKYLVIWRPVKSEVKSVVLFNFD